MSEENPVCPCNCHLISEGFKEHGCHLCRKKHGN